MQVHPHPGGLRDQLNTNHTNPTLKPGGLSNGDSPEAFALALAGSVSRRLYHLPVRCKEHEFSRCATEEQRRGLWQPLRRLLPIVRPTNFTDPRTAETWFAPRYDTWRPAL
jgi:hypothetical protein